MISNLNDGTKQAPYLRTDLCLGMLNELPVYSQAPKGEKREVYLALKAAGFRGLQGGDVALCRELGLGCTTSGRVNRVGSIHAEAVRWKDQGYACATLHVGWGMESDDEMYRLAEDILEASVKTNFPLYIETHRATITQDMWRTVKLVERLPEIRFNGDFSHWYTGLEMPYGNFEEKLDFCQPVFNRVRFMHGRIGNSCCMQVDIGEGKDLKHVEHFETIWIRCFEGFLKSARLGDFISFAPELLSPVINYARVFRNEKGEWQEECDRWQQALVLTKLAQSCFNAACERMKNREARSHARAAN